MSDVPDSIASAFEEQRKRIEELEKALEPFARNACAGDGSGFFEVPDGQPARFHDLENPSRPTLTEGDFRRARKIRGERRETL